MTQKNQEGETLTRMETGGLESDARWLKYQSREIGLCSFVHGLEVLDRKVTVTKVGASGNPEEQRGAGGVPVRKPGVIQTQMGCGREILGEGCGRLRAK